MEPGTPNALNELLNRLYARASHHVIKLGLETELALLSRLGNPHLRMPHVHVAGTNGKGSVCAMIEAALRAAGRRTGLYTSPHLVRFNERIRVAGRCIPDEELAKCFPEIDAADRKSAAAPGGRQSTFFEFTTALAFEHFRKHGVEISVLETGLGGRLDATNVVKPLVSVITRIDIEHTQYLGETIEEIAAEKGGIIKPGCAVVCGAMPDAARAVIRRIAGERGARLIPVEDAVLVRRVSQDLHGHKIRFETASGTQGTVTVPLLGKCQLENIALAIAAIEYLSESSPFVIEPDALKKGLGSLRWPARCQVLSAEPPVILDVAHNPNAAHALADTLKELLKKQPIGLIASLLSDKDCHGFMSALAPLVKRGWMVQIENERARPLDELLACARTAGLEATGHSLPEALKLARAWAAESGGAVCIAGSLFLAGDVLRLEGLGEKLYEEES